MCGLGLSAAESSDSMASSDRRLSWHGVGLDGGFHRTCASPGSVIIDRAVALLDWSEIDHALAGISAAAKGERGWPSLALFRAVLLATWHDLSDVRLAEALDDRASFRRSCGSAGHEPRRSGPPSCGSGPSWCAAVLIDPCSSSSRAGSMRAAYI